jgi:hypothetical protein
VLLWALVIVWLLVVGGATAYVAFVGFRLSRKARRMQAAMQPDVDRLNAGAELATARSQAVSQQAAVLQQRVAILTDVLAVVRIEISALAEVKSGLDRIRAYFSP